MQLSHTGSEDMLGNTRRCNRLQLLTKPLLLLYEIGFIDHRSRFHISRLFYWFTEHCGLTILVDHFKFY